MRLPKLALAGITLVGMAATPALAQRTSDVGTPGGSVHEVRHRGSAYGSYRHGHHRGHQYGRYKAHRGHHYSYRGHYDGYRSHYYGHRGRYYAPRGHFYLDAPYARHYGYPYYGFRYYAPYGAYGFSFRW